MSLTVTVHGGEYLSFVPPVVFQGLLALSILWAVSFLLRLLHSFYIYFLRPSPNLRKYGEWAIVTGSTDGIGKAISEEFARKKLNLVLLSRTQSKLQEQAQELESKYKIKTKVLAVDFTSSDEANYEKIKSLIQDLEIGILVNNVGMSYDHAEYFANLEKEKIQQLIQINIWSTVRLTHLVLPKMVARKRGAIINISSASSMVGEPMYAVYSGTKGFINNFTDALHYEYKSQGIHVQCQVPAFVATKMSRIRNASFFVCSPRGYAKSFVRAIGREPLILTYWTHALQIYIAKLLPKWMTSKYLLARGVDIRRRALKKKAEKQQ